MSGEKISIVQSEKSNMKNIIMESIESITHNKEIKEEFSLIELGFNSLSIAILYKKLIDLGVEIDFSDLLNAESVQDAKDILAQSDKEYTVIFSKEEMEKMASDPKYYAEKMHSIEGVLRMTDEINAQFGFERAFGKTNDNADADTKITKFGISFNSDGTTTFFAQLEKSSASQKEYLEKLQEKKAAEKKEAKKKEQSKQTEVRKTTVQANSKEELLLLTCYSYVLHILSSYIAT